MLLTYGTLALLLAAPIRKDTPADILYRELGMSTPADTIGEVPVEYAADEVDAAAVRKNPKKYPFRAAILEAATLIRPARTAPFEKELKPIRAVHPFGNKFEKDPPQRHCVDESPGQISDGSAIVPNMHQDLREKYARLQLDLTEASRLLQKVAHLRDKELSPRWRAHFDLLSGEANYRRVQANNFGTALGSHWRVEPLKKETVWKLVTDVNPRSQGLRDTLKLAQQTLTDIETTYPATPWAKQASLLLSIEPNFRWVEFPEE